MTSARADDAREAPVVSIVSDDLTGAMDSSVQFAYAGWNAQLLLDDGAPGSREHGSVSAFVTDARAMSDEEARTRTHSAALAGAETATRLFLKIDSTLRGSVDAQIDGVVAAWRQTRPEAFALVCPAYPAMGRTIVDGRLLVNGTPAHETSIGSDPVTPVTTSSVADLIPGSSAVSAPAVGTWSKKSLLAAITTARTKSSVITGHSAALMLLGGEGGRAVLSRLGATRLNIHTTVREGIPIGAIEGGIAAGATVITKAGGFGSRTDVADIAEELLRINSEGIRL